MQSRQDIVLRDDRVEMAHYQPPSALPPELPEPSILRGIFRHFWLVVLFALLGAGAAWFYLRNAKPYYLSESKIYIEPSGPKILSETLGSAQRSNYLYTQAELIKSTPILSIVAQKPEIRSLKTFRGNDPVLYLRDQVEADVGRKDDLISVYIYSPYAEEAATIVTAVVNAYHDYQFLERKDKSSTVLDALQQKKTAADQDLKVLEDQKAKFTKEHPNLTIDAIYQAELQTLSSAYTAAQLDTIEKAASYLKDNPVLVRAQKKEQDLYNTYNDKFKLVIGLNVVQADYEQLLAEVTRQKTFTDSLEQRIREVQVTQGAEQIFNMVTVLEPARVASTPSLPRPNRTMAASIIAGMLLGAGLALLRDRLDGRMRSVEEIQTVIGLPILGVVPAMTGRRTAVARAMAVHLDPRSPVAEAYRTIRTAVYFGAAATRSKTILVTSPEPGDGKTTSASNLAIAIAQTGRSVLLLDADFRKPTQHKNLDIQAEEGLSSVLAGREPLERAIQHTGVEGLDILPCGPIPANPSEILNSREFGELIDSLAARYDHIIFDSPPINAVTDARILSAVCDSTILVLRADKSTRKSGEHARNGLMAVGARVLGAIVNDAPNRKGYEVYGGSYYGSPETRSQAPALMRPVA